MFELLKTMAKINEQFTNFNAKLAKANGITSANHIKIKPNNNWE